MVLPFLLSIPFMGYILAFLFASIAAWVGSVFLGWAAFTLVHLVILGAGIYILLLYTLPRLADGVPKNQQQTLWILTVLGLVFIVLGWTKLFPGTVYAVVLP